MQDSQGYMWFATDVGVSRFNGQTFTNFTVSDGLTDNEVFEIHEDGNGRLWFLTYSGVPCYYQKGKFHNPDNTPFLSEITAGGFLSCFLEGPDGSVYLGKQTGQVYRIYNDQTVEQVLTAGFDEPEARYLFVHKNQVHALVYHDVILNLSTGQRTSLHQPHLNRAFQEHLFIANSLYVGNYNRLQIFTQEFEDYNEIHLEDDEGILAISDGFEDGQLAICTRKGIRFFDTESQRLSPRYLEGKQVLSTYIDSKGGLWASTMENGVYYAPFSDMTNHPNNNRAVHSLVSIDDMICFGGKDYQYGIIREDSLEGYQLHGVKAGINGRIEDFYFIHSYYIITVEKNLFVSKSFEGPYVGFDYASLSVCPGASGNLWVGGNTGIMLVDPEHIEQPDPILDYEIGKRVFDLIPYEDSTMLVGTPTGALRIFLKDSSVQEVFPETRQKRVTGLHRLDDDKVLVATDSWGVYVYDGENLVAHFNNTNGLVLSKISRILADDRKGLWLCGPRGILYLPDRTQPVEDWQWHSADHSNGLAVDRVNDAAVAGDKLYVASNAGITVFNVPDFFGPDEPPRLSVRHFQRSNSSSQVTYTGEKLGIPSAWKAFSVEYDGIVFPAQKLKYRFQLDDGEWQETSLARIDFVNLSADEHTLRISVRSDFSEWSRPTELRFEVEAEFWQSWWFQLLSFLFGIAFLFMLFRLKIVLVDQKLLLSYLRKMVERASKRSTITLKVGAESVRVSINSILWIKSEGNYCSVVTTNRKMLVYASLKSFEDQLKNEKQFTRVHRGYVVNLERIKSVKRNQLNIGETTIPIGETYLLSFRASYASYKGS